MTTAKFRNGDTVMVCKHIYEKSSCRVVQKLNVIDAELRRGGRITELNPPWSFTRPHDGSKTPAVSFTVACLRCLNGDPRDIDYVEQLWRDGSLHVADFMSEAGMNEDSTFRPIVPPLKRPVTFTPAKGLLAVGKKLADHLGLGGSWEGENGLEGVIRQKLGEVGVPQKPIEITGPKGLTIRQFAEESGFIKRAKPQRRRVR